MTPDNAAPTPDSASESTLRIARKHTRPGVHPYDDVRWELRTARVGRPGEKPKFEQHGVEVPEFWSQNATDIVAQKYFAYGMDDPRRESSVSQLIDRVVNTISAAGMKNGYFADEDEQAVFEAELTHILVNQKAAFNSPVWFNVGVDGAAQQCSACQPGHALVSTPEGLVPMGALVAEDAVGREVYDRHGVTTIVATKSNGLKQVFRVNLGNGQFVEATGDHLVLAARSWHSAPEWLCVAELKSGMRMELHPHRAKVTSPALVAASGGMPDVEDVLLADAPDATEVSEAALAGWLHADGFVGQYAEGTNRSLTMEFMVAAGEEESWVQEHLSTIFPDVHQHRRRVETKEGELWRIRLYGEQLSPFVERWGLLARRGNIRVPEHLYTAPVEVISAYLRSLFQADGYVTGQETSWRVGFAVISELWTEDVQLLLNVLGIYSKRRRKQEPRPDRQDIWEVDIAWQSERARFSEMVGFIEARKQARVDASLALHGGRTCKDAKSERIVGIESVGVMEVFDIQTESGEYLTNNIAVHNCFILSIEDKLESISAWQAEETLIFKRGSGSGVNLSNLRGSVESLALGGNSSGPVTFMRAADANAGTIQSGGTCLAPSQRVYTAEHGPCAVKELADLGQDFTVISYDPPAGRYKAKTARAWKTLPKRVLRIHTDKGEFELTYDHPIKLSSGETKRVEELVPGMSLFACSVDRQHGHLRVHLRDGKKGKEFLHRLVAKDVMGADVSGLSVHHDDENKDNNACSNLKPKSQSQHAADHGRALAASGKHIFQHQAFPQRGSENGMHADSAFWQDEERVAAYAAAQSELLLERGDAADMQKAAAQQKMLNTAFSIMNAGHSIEDFEAYVAGRKQAVGRIPSIRQLRATIDERFGSYEAFQREVAASNHRVLRVEDLGVMDVYDVEVDCPTADDKSPRSGHNFVIWSDDDRTGSGIVVFNTRRAAKMVVLDVDHPDIEDFIWCKAREEDRIRALQAAGFEIGIGTAVGEKNLAEATAYQNANNSVRLTQAFLDAVAADGDWELKARTTGETTKTVSARELMRELAEAAWRCADPGVQYDTVINDWHTTPAQGRISASNPCCFVGETLVDTSEGKLRFDELQGMAAAGQELPYVFSYALADRLPVLRPIRRVWVAGRTRTLVEVRTQRGQVLRCTPEHRFLTHDGEYVEAQHLSAGTRLRKVARFVNEQRSGRHYINHRATDACANGTSNQARFMWEQVYGHLPSGMDVHHRNEDPTDDRLSNFELRETAAHKAHHSSGQANPRFINCPTHVLVDVWEAIEARPLRRAGEAVTPARWNAHIRENELAGIVPQAQSPTTGGRIQGRTWDEFSEYIELERVAVNDSVISVAKVELDNEVPVYDLQVEGTHNFAVACDGVVPSVVVHNSEYMSNDDTSCNLASLNLLKFLKPDGTFDVEDFQHCTRVMFTAQDITITFGDFPTELIGENSRKFRQIGTGFANLGALLMAMGLPYDSEEGREVAGSITALMTGECYLQSTHLAERVGTFHHFDENRKSMLRVMRKHGAAARELVVDQPVLLKAAQKVWKDVIRRGSEFGFHNAQATVLAPTGTIAFMMDCDTTGVEPDFSLVKFKTLAGGGSMVIPNRTVPMALKRLGYNSEQADAILTYIAEEVDKGGGYKGARGIVVGAPYLSDEHYPVFDTAVGERAISWRGHIDMMAACQPFLSGAISKTVNLPETATIDEIEEVYLYGGRVGLKAVAVYRDNCKAFQPLGESKTKNRDAEVEKAVEERRTSILGDGLLRGERRKVAREANLNGVNFTVGMASGYITIREFEDGRPGAIFVDVGQAGSTLAGFIKGLTITMSLGFQYGMPVSMLVSKLAGMQFEPYGFTNDPDIRQARSLVDYIVKWLALEYLDDAAHAELGIGQQPAAPAESFSSGTDDIAPKVEVHAGPKAAAAPVSEVRVTDMKLCPVDGSVMTRTGACFTCPSCGTSSGGCG